MDRHLMRGAVVKRGKQNPFQALGVQLDPPQLAVRVVGNDGDAMLKSHLVVLASMTSRQGPAPSRPGVSFPYCTWANSWFHDVVFHPFGSFQPVRIQLPVAQLEAE